jgi:hypothetical protein
MMLISAGAIWSMSSAPPVREKAPSSSACRMTAGSRNRSSDGGAMRSTT